MRKPTDSARDSRRSKGSHACRKVPHGGRKVPRGVAALGVFVCLMVVSSLTALLVNDMWARVKEARHQRLFMQGDWLAASAIDRALQSLHRDAAYQGETWRIPPEELDGRHHAEVLITLTQAGSERREIVVQTQVLAGDQVLVKLTRRIPW